ncbi:MAG: molecular chaperone DnaJ [Bacteroidales bacterium]|nr:molecular chaperone DnaJ [Bacteroidales bacterium]
MEHTVRKHIEEHLCICRRCNGTGVDPEHPGRPCPQCDGSGRVVVSSDVVTNCRPYVPNK